MESKKIEISEDLTPEQIQSEYNVSRATAWRASKRGWLYQNYHGDQSGEPVKDGIRQKFVRLVSHPAITTAQLTSMKEQKIRDIIAGKSTLRKPDWITFKAEWAEIRNLLRKFSQSSAHDYKVKQLGAICADARIKQHILLENKKMLDRLTAGLNVYPEEISQSEEKISDFLNKTQL